ncbi:hypothetical protein [Streptomyces sp. NBC_01314]|uniref:hypothetical protein n=1 Tax=Streptomyces sp. NBC_01314 TaxID=2903821 RepID=UPI00352CE1D1
MPVQARAGGVAFWLLTVAGVADRADLYLVRALPNNAEEQVHGQAQFLDRTVAQPYRRAAVPSRSRTVAQP